jgi:2-keto-4-pentenoate hydratase
LAQVNVRAGLLIDGAEVCFATGAAVLGNPLTSLTWLANDLPKLLAGQHLKAGDVVMSGAICASTAFDVGSTLEVCFAGLRKDRDCTVQAKFI